MSDFNLRDNLGDLTVKYVQLRPVNQNSDNKYSYKGGLPLIRFEINDSMAPLMLNGAQLRLTGKITASKSDGTTQLVNTENNYINRFAGVSSVIDNVTISSRRLNSVIERVQNYNRLLQFFSAKKTEIIIDFLALQIIIYYSFLALKKIIIVF